MKLSDMTAVVGIQPSVFVINWNIGRRCNFACSYCPKDLHDSTSHHLSHEQLIAAFTRVVIAKQAAGDNRAIRLEITGGEPTLNPHLVGFLEWLRTQHGTQLDTVGLTTNGSRSTDFYSNLIESLDYITFSAHFEFMNPGDFVRTVLLTARKASSHFSRKVVTVNLMMEPWASNATSKLLSVLEAETVPVRCTKVRNYYASDGLKPRWTNDFDYDAFTSEYGPPIDQPRKTVNSFDLTGKVGTPNPRPLIDVADNRELKSPDDKLGAWVEDDVRVKLRDGAELLTMSSSLIDNGLNSFVGWRCCVGSQGIHIYGNGDVYSSICRAKKLGSIFVDFSFENTPLVCRKEQCVCPADIRIPKERLV